MIDIKLILVPVDFSDTSEHALKYGRALAATFKSALHLLHVVQDPYTQPWTAEAAAFNFGTLLEEWQREAHRHLEAMMPAEERRALGAELVIRVGSPFLEIVQYAAEHHVDLIVMGTHGRGPVAHVLLGSVAEKTIRKAPCPVLTVRHPQHEFVKS
jgi:nucleotide-binding universal stress UspA family protein